MSYSVGDKFVLEIKEIDDFKNHIVLEKIAVDIGMLDQLERLDSDYINEHYGELQDESYNKGLEDAWKLARKIFTFNNGKMEQIFGCAGKRNVFDDLTPQEALAKFEAYEKEQAEIKVGDVVTDKEHTTEILVTANYGSYFDGIKVTPDDGCGSIGAVYSGIPKYKYIKTGKYIDIHSVLQQICK